MTDEVTKARSASGKPCPICSKPATTEHHPFCSRRCADVDLNRWLGGVYAVPAAPSDEDESSALDDEAEGRR